MHTIASYISIAEGQVSFATSVQNPNTFYYGSDDWYIDLTGERFIETTKIITRKDIRK